MRIELATPEQLSTLLPYAHRYFKESKYPGTFNEERWVKVWKTLIESKWGAITTAWAAGQPSGALGWTLTPDYMTGDLTSQMMFWYVRPQYRRGMLGMRLLTEYEKEAESRGALYHRAGIRAEADPRIRTILCVRAGYELSDCLLRKKVTHERRRHSVSGRVHAGDASAS